MRRAEALKDGEEIIGNRLRVKVAKNKVAPPFLQAEFDLTFGEGFSKEGDLLDVAVEQDVIQKSGSWFSYNDERLGQGRNNVKEYLKENPEAAAEIDAKVRELAGLPIASTTGAIPEADEDDDESEE
jgi:recombination protein RecA